MELNQENLITEEKINKSNLIIQDLENLVNKIKKDFNIKEGELF